MSTLVTQGTISPSRSGWVDSILKTSEKITHNLVLKLFLDEIMALRITLKWYSFWQDQEDDHHCNGRLWRDKWRLLYRLFLEQVALVCLQEVSVKHAAVLCCRSTYSWLQSRWMEELFPSDAVQAALPQLPVICSFPTATCNMSPPLAAG